MPVRRRTPSQNQAENARRLRFARIHLGHVELRLSPQIRIAYPYPSKWASRQQGGHWWAWGGLFGQASTVNLPEAVDVWALLSDLSRFMKAWRPARMRSAAAAARAAALLEELERLV